MSLAISLLKRICRCQKKSSFLLAQKRELSLSHFCRQSNEQDFVDLTANSQSGVATMNLRKPPVNSLTLELFTELCSKIDQLHSDRVRGQIFGSSVESIFSAGIDLETIYQPDKPHLREYWRNFQEVWIKLYGSRMVTVATIKGHAPGAGCLLSLCFDHRIMADGRFTIGLNETLLGLVAPIWIGETMLNIIGHRETERALQLGKLYTPLEALSIGLVDAVAPLEQVDEEANIIMKQWLRIPDEARYLTKLQMRQKTIDRLVSRREEDIDYIVDFMTRDSIQTSLGIYVEVLKKKSQTSKK